ncbi:pyridoxal-phosphate dependent enzyme [Pontibacter sp. G13]|uniref:pyridoxal-phosphate dependent enzyme n=1 Tax=Pontibacter sp. G13 TaxID=3074898 RepID=UPI00288AA382|nr:pyridoxal-phosphate dependent enzyme [Pontibacter sp. G13]WNJ16758.1 pyridoxal-phosphate dependent enzyme [Pontibacter sp. G13]
MPTDLISLPDWYHDFLTLCDQDWITRTRIHPLKTFDTQAPGGVWVKREDESGFGISGTKKRKYASIIQALRTEGVREVSLVGGSRSNHIVGMLQILKELDIRPKLFLKEEHSAKLTGNRFLLDLLADPDSITWVPSERWHAVNVQAISWAMESFETRTSIPEGGSYHQAVPGLASLLGEIVDQETELGRPFDHIWMDAGTGFSAAVTAVMMHLVDHPAKLHVVMAAGTAEEFQKQMNETHEIQSITYDLDLAHPPLPDLIDPATAKSFGAVNATIRQYVRDFAQREGILLDPIYTAKLFYTFEQLHPLFPPEERHLVIHSGGGTGLMGFAGMI